MYPESTVQQKTPLRRLVAALCIGKSITAMVVLIPISLLLSFQSVEISPHNYTTVFSLVSGIGAIFALIGNPIGGAISDRTRLQYGRRRTWILLGSILGSAAMVGVIFSKSVVTMAIFWSLVQFFYNFAYAAYMALVPDQVDEAHRGSVSGIIGLALPIAVAVGYILMTVMSGTPLAMRWGVLVVMGVLSAVISCFMITDPKAVYQKRSERKSFAETVSGIYPSPRRYPVFTWGILTKLFQSMAYCYQLYNSTMLMQRFKLNQVQTTEYATLMQILALIFMGISSVLGGMLSDKIRRQKPFVICSVLVMSAGLILMAAAKTILIITVANVIISFGYGIYTAVDTAMIARILPRKADAAKDYGIMNVADTLPQSVVPAIAAPLILIGSWPLFYGVLCVCGILSAVTVLPIPEMSRKQQAEEPEEALVP